MHLVGELDLATVAALEAALATLPKGAEYLDLTELTFMDASGLHALERYAWTQDGSGPLVLENVPANIRRLFELTGADRNPQITLRGGSSGG